MRDLRRGLSIVLAGRRLSRNAASVGKGNGDEGVMYCLRSKIRRTLSVICILVTVNALAQNCCDGRVLTVRPGMSLQETLSAATPGDTVVVHAGRYCGNLRIDRRLTLIGEDSPALRGTDSGSVVTITADSCTLRGFTIEHSGAMLTDEDAGVLVKSAHNRIEECLLQDVLFGIYLLHAENNIIAGNRISGRTHLDSGDRGNGIHVWNARGNRLIHNVIAGMRDGLYLQNAALTWIEGNDISDLRYGVHYMYADSNTFLKNVFHHNVAGAAVMYSRGIRIRHNVFVHNRGFASYGILFQDCHDVLADSNVVADNETGMFLEASTGNTFRDNLVARNDIALEMFQNSTENTFTRNSFLDNLAMLQLIGKRTGSRWSEDGAGNYWSGYEGYDLGHDGVGDIPMKIQDPFQYIEARNRIYRLYLYSPVSQALGAAAKAFPVVAINAEQDPAPLMAPPRMEEWPAMRLATGIGGRATAVDPPATMALALPLLVGIVAGAVYFQRKRRGA